MCYKMYTLLIRFDFSTHRVEEKIVSVYFWISCSKPDIYQKVKNSLNREKEIQPADDVLQHVTDLAKKKFSQSNILNLNLEKGEKYKPTKEMPNPIHYKATPYDFFNKYQICYLWHNVSSSCENTISGKPKYTNAQGQDVEFDKDPQNYIQWQVSKLQAYYKECLHIWHAGYYSYVNDINDEMAPLYPITGGATKAPEPYAEFHFVYRLGANSAANNGKNTKSLKGKITNIFKTQKSTSQPKNFVMKLVTEYVVPNQAFMRRLRLDTYDQNAILNKCGIVRG